MGGSRQRLQELEQAWSKKRVAYQQQLEREGTEIVEARGQLQVVEQNREHFRQVWEREARPPARSGENRNSIAAGIVAGEDGAADSPLRLLAAQRPGLLLSRSIIKLEFEWHDAKAEVNLQAHGVSFDLAKTVFEDPFAVERLDDREDYGEERFVIIGMAEGRVVLFVAYTEREERIRIISARRATQNEQDDFFRQNA